MKFLDMLRMSSGNLWKRKVRTILTVLGVVIGVASIVVMISFGLGLSRTLLEQYESWGSLTQVTIYEPWGDDVEDLRLDDDLVKEIEGLDHVESVWPILQISAIAKYGSYQSWLQIRAVPKEAYSEMNIDVGEGRLPGEDDELTFFYGNEVLQNFYNTKGSGGYYWDTGILPDIDLMNDAIFVIFDTDAYYSAGNTDENGQTIPQPKKYLIPACGVEATMEDGWSQYGWYTHCDIEQLMPQLKKIFKNRVIPGQPTTKTGKPYKEVFYNQILVNVDKMESVMEVQSYLRNLGYDASSNAEWLQSAQEQMATIQLVLGAIGAVSLLVAAIGITNTMMMSIYERTKEIGVMKVLGCDLRNIRSLFLMEAGFIGFIGGVIGLALSFGLSGAINRAVIATGEYENGISYIPFWLVLLSLVFAILVGMVAGFFPARRAMKLSPLAAIRNE